MSTGQQTASATCGREGNRWSGVALAMHHRLWYIHLQAQVSKYKRDGHSAYKYLASIMPFSFLHSLDDDYMAPGLSYVSSRFADSGQHC